MCARLGVPFDKINIIQNDSDEMSEGAGASGGSRSMLATGGAIVECSEVIIENGKQLAGHILEAATEDIEFGDGVFSVVGTDRGIGIMELAAQVRDRADLPDELPKTLSHKVNHKTHPISFPNGCHVVEVEIDPDTGEVAIDRYTVVDDFGVVVNPMVVEGQVHGGIMQGIGQVLVEDTVYDGDGQLLTGTFMDYTIPRADEVTNISFSTHPVPCVTNPLGVKGCGEAGNGGSYPGVYNAIMDAIAGRANKELGIPATPARIWQAIHSR
jgi:carbon-monoxide dehydrogenase large subunit